MALICREVSGHHKELQVHVPVLRICGRPCQHLALHRQLHQLSSAGARAQTRGDVQTRRARGADGDPRRRRRRRWSGAAALREQRRRHAARNQHLSTYANSEDTAKAVEALLDHSRTLEIDAGAEKINQCIANREIITHRFWDVASSTK